MAKKKKTQSLNKILLALAALLGVASFCMMFVSAAIIPDTDYAYTGANLTFGYKQSLVNYEYVLFNFSFMNLLTYILVVVGVVFAVLAVLGKLGKIAPLVASVAFLVAGIFFFCSIAFCALNENFDNFTSGLTSIFSGTKKSGKDILSLGAGAIVGGVLSLLAMLASASTLVLGAMKK